MARTDHPAAPTHRQHDGHSGHGGKRAKNKKNKKNKRKGEMLPQLGEQNSVLAAAGSPRLASSPLSGGSIGKKRKILSSAPDHQTTTPCDDRSNNTKQKRAKRKPPRFTHPALQSELTRLRRPWLSPGDALFEEALASSYRGLRHVPAADVPTSVHKGFRRAFDSLSHAGLFLYDTVQAGGKRLSRTFVTRTLVGDAGITYKYLGLRLFAHPWDRDPGFDFRTGPGDALANALDDPCEKIQRADVGSTLRDIAILSSWMHGRAVGLLRDHSRGVGAAEGVAEGGGETGSCDFNLTLINRMECSSTKRDLKPDPLFSMGKCSVSWHADSCLQDFSTIGVYHCTDPVPAEPDWGIAVRVSQEAEGSDISMSNVENATAEKRSAKEGGNDVTTPPLLVPLQSGDAYFLLDDFK
ncbi:unnamed protein product [Sphacelaria rigidula]